MGGTFCRFAPERCLPVPALINADRQFSYHILTNHTELDMSVRTIYTCLDKSLSKTSSSSGQSPQAGLALKRSALRALVLKKPASALSTVRWIIKSRVKSVKVFGIQMILYEPQAFTESLEVYDLPLPQEADGVANFRVFHQPENVVIGAPGFLFCSQVFRQVGDRIAL